MPTSSSPSLAQSLHTWARNASNESALLQTSLSLGLFKALPHEPTAAPLSVEALAHQLGASVRGIRALLELLLCMGLVRMDDARGYSLSSSTAALLADAGFLARLQAELPWWHPMGRLDEALQHGGPVVEDPDRWDVLGHYRELFLDPTKVCASPEAEDFFDRFARGAARTQLLITAGRLGLLDLLASGPHSLTQLGTATKLSLEGLRVMVEVLATMGLLREEAGAWGLSAEARPLLEGKALAYLVRALSVSSRYWEALGRLDETVRTEHFILDLKDPETSRRFYADNSQQITAVFATHFQLGRKAVETLAQVRPLERAQVLDIGTGSGVWGAAFARSTPTTHVTYFDQDVVLEQVRANLERLKVAERARFWPGDLLTHDFGEQAFDVIVLPQVLNVLRPESLPGLFARVARALKPDGVLLIAEYVLNERRDGPLEHLYFGLRRFMTNEGDLLSASEYAHLLKDVGLTASVCIPLPTQELILATRSGIPLPTRLAA
ncbi:class I SAM-dependent methyltransferase [Myxococcus landrumensis]|uniref:Class I SAM-dependent methyltransferase n=1 Tax=Myxococcus landrumensis TaxID=2813577 RepID=A0ABX7NG75_9BACT|nr:class I SAM-dependent methyltransferase [Myxococcus landrumus]QSQ17765.1 class I SAM-dependent methyltransferase [Myxococcus landrumus]